jgi:type IV secretory pathway VirB10-like protein
MGLLTLVWLGARRSEAAESHGPVVAASYVSPPPTPAEIANFASPVQPPNAVAPTTPVAAPHPEAPAPVTGDPSYNDLAAAQAVEAGLRAPALVIDLGDQAPVTAQSAGTSQSSGGDMPSTASAGTPAGAGGLNGDEQFAHRVGAEQPDRSQATRIDNLRDTIPQGAMIPGVMETALDSDLPGYTRAVVSRDVRGFDGTAVLIPRGSRVIGEYKNAASEGQTRAFIVWTRIIRPDGASIQIGSSGTDQLGRAGLSGSVNRHLLERYGGAILLSVIDAGVTSLERTPSTQVIIGSTTQTSGIGTSITPANISPTIKVPQGAAIRIFVARDLDFSSAEHDER